MNKGTKRTSAIIRKIQERRNPIEFRRTRGKMWLAAKIAEGIEKKRWTKTEFAIAIDQTQSTISRWLSGHHNFTVDTLNDIEYILGIELLNWERRKLETDKEVKGTIPSIMNLNVFLIGESYSSITDEEAVRIEIFQNPTNIQVIKECNPVDN